MRRPKPLPFSASPAFPALTLLATLAAPGSPCVARADPVETAAPGAKRTAPKPRAGRARPAPSAPAAAGAATPALSGRAVSGSETGASGEDGAPGVAPEKPVWLFPDWGAPSFDWSPHPVIGFRYVDDPAMRVRSSTLEGGLQAHVWGIPLKEGNPGASLAPHAGYALGFVTAKPYDAKEKTGFYHRVWGGIEAPLLVKFTRTTLGVRYAQINGKLVAKSRMGAFDFDEGLLVLPFLAAHYTYGYVRLFETRWAQRSLESQDNWISLRFFTSFLNASLAVGPGVTFAKSYVPATAVSSGATVGPVADGSTTLFADTRTDSLRGVAGSDLFWKLRASVDSRYVLKVRRKSGGAIENLAPTRLPNQAISDAPALPLYPEDTLVTSAFLGIKGLVGGLGFGYRYTLEYRDLGERDGRRRRKKEDSGVGVFYEAKL